MNYYEKHWTFYGFFVLLLFLVLSLMLNIFKHKMIVALENELISSTTNRTIYIDKNDNEAKCILKIKMR